MPPRTKEVPTLTVERYDYIVIGAGMYGLYAARLLARRGQRVAVIEADDQPFTRASYVNQARVHKGYHYPRSIYTANKSAGYYDRFNSEFAFAVNRTFKKVYAISKSGSLTNAEQFERFSRYMGIPCEEINPLAYFRPGVVEATFETEECAFDAMMIKDFLWNQLKELPNADIFFGMRMTRVENTGNDWRLTFADGRVMTASGVLNATYASMNQVNALFGFESFKTKYEICEVVLVNVSEAMKDVGVTIMDGPFFSMMPFGYAGYHSLTSVTHTPHQASHSHFPEFECQKVKETCSPQFLENCNTCAHRPASAWPYMFQIAKKYLNDRVTMEYRESLWSMKTVLLTTETSDARPTMMRRFSDQPFYASVLSGKINTVYDLEDLLA